MKEDSLPEENMKNQNASSIRIKKTKKIILYLLSFLLIFSLGYMVRDLGFSASTENGNIQISREIPEDRPLDFSLFWRVWDTLDSKYFDQEKLSTQDLIYGSIKGLVSAVGDPYTVFLPPDENRIIREDLQGTFEGVGIQIGFKGTRLAVIAPLPESPAERAGIKAGDLIVGIKDVAKDLDRNTVGITLPEAVEAIRGPAGSTVTLVLIRGESETPILVDVVREAIDVPSIIISNVNESGEVDESGSIVHIRLLKFSGETTDEWNRNIIEILKNPNITSVILDLRNNPGGFLQSSVDIASDFLELGSVVVIEENSNGEKNEFKTEKIGKLTNMKIVILINEGSASASEILAGALRDQAGLVLVGETSFGKGTIQEPIQVNGNSGLHITVAKWLTPSGYWVNGVGLIPDFEISDDPETEQDEQLLKAIEQLLN